MSLATLLLGIWGVLVGLAWLGWVAVNVKLLGALALVWGALLLLEGFGAFSYRLGRGNPS